MIKVKIIIMSSKEKLNKHHPQPKGHDSIDNC